MSSEPQILFVCNAGPAVGGGHVMRSLTLARAIQSRAGRCIFLAAPQVTEILNAFGPDLPRIPAPDASPEALIAAAAAVPFDAVVFDHYGLAAPEHAAIAGLRPALVIDDLADRPLAAALVLDSSPQRRAQDYAGLAPPGAELLLGPEFAPVRPEFAARRASALARRSGPVRRILVSLGLTDVGGITLDIVQRLRPLIGEARLDVVVGSAAPSRRALEALASEDARLVVHVETPDMARLTAEADVAIGAAGSTTWERCVLGLPSIALVLAENQRPAASTLSAAGAAIGLEPRQPEFGRVFQTAVRQLFADEALRARISSQSAQVCDGRGAERAAQAFLGRIGGAS